MGVSLLAFLALVVQEPAPEPAEKDLGLKVGVLGWYATPGGSVTITRGSRPGTGTPVEIDRDIDLGSEVAPTLEARWEFLESHAVGVRASLLDFSGTRTTNEAFVYRGLLFDAGRTVHAEMDFTLIPFDYQYTAVRAEDFSLGLHLGAEYWKFSARLRTEDALPPLSTQRSFDSAFWMTGADIDWRPHPSIDLQVRALGGIERTHQYFFDLDARALWNPWKSVGFALGYRYQELHFRQSTNRSNLHFQGPEIGVELRF